MVDGVIVVLGKSGCGKCASAKEKLELMGLPYHAVELDTAEGRDHPSADDALAAAADGGLNIGNDIPIIVIDGVAYKYAEAMKTLKARKA